MSTPVAAPTPAPVHPLRKVIDALEEIIDVQKANPKDPKLMNLVLNVQVELSTALRSIIGEDDGNRAAGS